LHLALIDNIEDRGAGRVAFEIEVHTVPLYYPQELSTRPLDFSDHPTPPPEVESQLEAIFEAGTNYFSFY
jgi:hypothetical protein